MKKNKAIKKARKPKARKTAAKKTKKTSSSKKAGKTINPENYFFAHDGRIIKDLFELAEAIEEMSDEAFSHHVTEERNDFSNWVRDVLEEPGLADEIIEICEPARTQVVILKHIVRKKGE